MIPVYHEREPRSKWGKGATDVSKQRYDVILFDADRTLFDFNRSQRAALKEVYQSHGIPVTEEMMALYVRINDMLWVKFDRGEITTEELTRVRFGMFLKEAGVAGQDPAAMNQQYLESLGRHSYLLEGAEELCRSLEPYCRQYIVTNGITIAQVGRLNQSPIRPYIKKMYISAELGIRKPEAGFFQIVYKDLHMTPQRWKRTVIVGDGLESDILGGQNACVDTIWYNPGEDENPTEIQPTWEAATFSGIRSIILGENPAETRKGKFGHSREHFLG